MSKQTNRTPMPEQKPEVRATNFQEVALGFTREDALREANRCLNCKKPLCVNGCPVQVKIPEFIQAIKEDDLSKAYDLITSTNSLPAVCGRVCPQEEQCESLCVLGIKGEPVAIGRLERYVADWAMAHPKEVKPVTADNGYQVAIVGAGPAGLTCAGDLARQGCKVTVFEAFHEPGGVLIYGIPEFRLPKELVKQEINKLKAIGVEFQYNVVVGRTITIDEMLEEMGFDAVFIGNGAGLPKFMGIAGENLNGVYSANEYLTRINLMKAYDPRSHTPIKKAKEVVVVGGGNVAMDAARCALRMGSKVHIVYRRSMKELPARVEEVHHAVEEGIQFDLLCNPVEIIGDNGWVKAVKCIRMELGEPDASGRRRPVEVPGSEFEIEADAVIMALGTNPNPLIRTTTPNLETNKWGGVVVDEQTMATSIPGVYAGGDTVTGAATVILAMGAGKTAANAMMQYLKEKKGN